MSGRLESIIRSKQGNTLIIGLVSIAILGVVVVAMSQAFFSMGRSRATVKAKTSFIEIGRAHV